MLQWPTPIRERLGRQVAGWSCLFGGGALWAMVILAPPWLEAGKLDHQRHRMQVRWNQHHRQLQSYQALEHALETSDPFVLEHMAYHQLGLKPVGAKLLDWPATAAVANIETWLNRFAPPSDQPSRPPATQRSLMTRLFSPSWARLVLIGIASGCIGFGLIWVSDHNW